MTEHHPSPSSDPPSSDTASQMAAAMTPARAMGITLAIVFVLGLVWLLIQVRSIIILLIIGVLLAAAIEPLVNRLRRYGLTRGQGILIIYGALLAIFVVATYFIVPRLIVQGSAFFDDIPGILDTLQRRVLGTRNDTIRTLGLQSVMKARQLYNEYRVNPPIQATDAFVFVTSLVGALFGIFSVLIVAFYWMTEKALIKRVTLSLFAIERRERAHTMWDQIEGKIGGWARGQLVLMLVIGVISLIALLPTRARLAVLVHGRHLCWLDGAHPFHWAISRRGSRLYRGADRFVGKSADCRRLRHHPAATGGSGPGAARDAERGRFDAAHGDPRGIDR